MKRPLFLLSASALAGTLFGASALGSDNCGHGLHRNFVRN